MSSTSSQSPAAAPRGSGAPLPPPGDSGEAGPAPPPLEHPRHEECIVGLPPQLPAAAVWVRGREGGREGEREGGKLAIECSNSKYICKT